MRRVALGLLVVALAPIAALLAQTAQGQTAAQGDQPPAQAPQPTFRTGVGVVRVDVTVTGQGDRPVTGLTAEDFEVHEDGQPQKVSSLQFVRLQGTRDPGDDTSLEIRSPQQAANEAARDDVRLIVIFLDDYHLRFGPQFDTQLKRLLAQFVDAEMQETDLFAVMNQFTPMDDLGLTRSKQKIRERIASFQGRLGGFLPPRSVLEESQLQLRGSDRQRVRVGVTMSALESLVKYLGALREGRKSVLFISEGPLAAYGDMSELSQQLRNVILAANRGNVTIHTLDPRGLGDMRSLSFVNDSLAADTGGRRLSQSNDYSKGLRAVIADASAYYLLGYSPSRLVADGKFHDIDVKVRRKGVRVLARKGYWAPTPQELNPPPPTPAAPADVTTALGRILPRSFRPAVEWWLGFERREGGTVATVSWEPAATLNPDPARLVARLSIRPDGKQGAEMHVAEGTTGGGPSSMRFAVSPGPHAMHVRAENADGHAVEEWVEKVDVPDLAGTAAALGTPRLYRAATPASWRALVASQDDVPPAANRRLRRTERALVTVPVYAPGEAVVRAELLNKHGTRLTMLPVRSGPRDRPGSAQIEIPLQSLAQAEYVLRVALGAANAPAASQTLAFAVVP